MQIGNSLVPKPKYVTLAINPFYSVLTVSFTSGLGSRPVRSTKPIQPLSLWQRFLFLNEIDDLINFVKTVDDMGRIQRLKHFNVMKFFM
jgi:hypothetical protein